MTKKSTQGILKPIAIIVVIFFGAYFITLVLEGVGEVIYSIPWFAWVILAVSVIYLVNKLSE